jgi:hypothetical protein
MVLPEMRIHAVNGIEGDVDKIIAGLGGSEDVELHIRRSLHSQRLSRVTSPPLTPGVNSKSTSIWKVDLGRCSSAGIGGSVVAHNHFDILQISSIDKSGPLSTWNAAKPSSAVKVGDCILEVSGAHSVSQMQQQLAESVVLLSVMRPLAMFTVALHRPEAGSFGIMLKRSVGTSPQHLVIAEIHPEGSMAHHNSRCVAEARSNSMGGSLVLPGMHVLEVNGIRDDANAMIQTFKKSTDIKLQVEGCYVPPPSTNTDRSAPGPPAMVQPGPVQEIPAVVQAPPVQEAWGSPCLGAVSAPKIANDEVTEVLAGQIQEDMRSSDEHDLQMKCLERQVAASSESTWQVQLMGGSQGFGFGIVDFREMCRSRCGVDIGMDVLLVSDVRPTGQLASWNKQKPHASIQKGDRILQVNHAHTVDEMQRELQISRDAASECYLQLSRPPKTIKVHLQKSGRPFGFVLKKPRTAPHQHLLIAEVVRGGAAADHNVAQAATGNWDAVVLPGMTVEMVNGINGNADTMVEEIARCQDGILEIHRVIPVKVSKAIRSEMKLTASAEAQSSAMPSSEPTLEVKLIGEPTNWVSTL